MSFSRQQICRQTSSIAVFLLILFAWVPAYAQEPRLSKKAMVVYNLSQFVVWPGKDLEESAADWAFCMLGEDPIGPEMRRLCRENPDGGNARFRSIAGLDAAKGCNLLYIGSDWSSRLPEVFDALGDHPVLTISTIRGFAGQGGMVEILSAADRVSFKINLDAVKGTGLIIDAPLLQIADVIREME